MASSNAINGPDDWQVDDDLRTLARAEEIRKDPKRFKAALAKAKEKISALQGLQGETSSKKTGKAD